MSFDHLNDDEDIFKDDPNNESQEDIFNFMNDDQYNNLVLSVE